MRPLHQDSSREGRRHLALLLPHELRMTEEEEMALAKELQSVVGEESNAGWSDGPMVWERESCVYSPTGPNYLRSDLPIRPLDVSGIVVSRQPQALVPSTPRASTGRAHCCFLLSLPTRSTSTTDSLSLIGAVPPPTLVGLYWINKGR